MKPRETQLDLLRLAALMGVIFTHAGDAATDSPVMAFLSATVTWHVPVFVMISGRFFLDPQRQYPPRKLVSACARLMIAWLFWNTLYQLSYLATGLYADLNFKGILWQWLRGTYHLWFLPMLVCLYAAVPLLRRIAEKKRLTELFLLLSLIFQTITQYGSVRYFPKALGFSGYFLLGYYLHRWPLSGRKEAALYIAGIGSFLLTGLATAAMTLRFAPGEEWFSQYEMPNVALEAAAIYSFFTNRVSIGGRAAERISALARLGFGGYLIHVFALAWVDCLPWQNWPVPMLASVFLRTLLTFAISLTAAALIRKIPTVGKRIT